MIHWRRLDDELVRYIVLGLPENWQLLKTVLASQCDLGLCSLCQALVYYFQRRENNSRGSGNGDIVPRAMKASTRKPKTATEPSSIQGTNRSCYSCGLGGHIARFCTTQLRQEGQSRRSPICSRSWWSRRDYLGRAWQRSAKERQRHYLSSRCSFSCGLVQRRFFGSGSIGCSWSIPTLEPRRDGRRLCCDGLDKCFATGSDNSYDGAISRGEIGSRSEFSSLCDELRQKKTRRLATLNGRQWSVELRIKGARTTSGAMRRMLWETPGRGKRSVLLRTGHGIIKRVRLMEVEEESFLRQLFLNLLVIFCMRLEPVEFEYFL